MPLLQQRWSNSCLEERYSGLTMLFERGVPVREIAQIVGISEPYAWRVLERLGYQRVWMHKGRRINRQQHEPRRKRL